MEKAYLQQFYNETVVPELKKNLGYTNIHQVPSIEKIVINTGFGANVEKGGADLIRASMSIRAVAMVLSLKYTLNISERDWRTNTYHYVLRRIWRRAP